MGAEAALLLVFPRNLLFRALQGPSYPDFAGRAKEHTIDV